jgi:hypothetical protein
MLKEANLLCTCTATYTNPQCVKYSPNPTGYPTEFPTLAPTKLDEWSHIEHAEELHTTKASNAALKGKVIVDAAPIKPMSASMLKGLVDAMGGSGTRRRLFATQNVASGSSSGDFDFEARIGQMKNMERILERMDATSMLLARSQELLATASDDTQVEEGGERDQRHWRVRRGPRSIGSRDPSPSPSPVGPE